MQKAVSPAIFLCLFCYFSVTQSCAQLPNYPFYDTLSHRKGKKRLSWHTNYLGYNKNNEYFNKIADGYTLFGQQLITTARYQPNAHLLLEGGVSFRRDFGRNATSEWLPLLRLKYQKGRFAFLFGTLEGHLNHRLIEPLFDFERLITRRLENGFQGWYRSPRFEVEAWVDWTRVIYPGSPFREEITGGLNSDYFLLRNPEQHLRIPVQLTGVHLGGQIDTAPEPLVTRFNLATGLVWQKNWANGGWLEQLEVHQYGTWYKDFSFNPTSLYDQGWGWYTHLNVKLKHLGNIGVSYWRGTTYESFLGGDLYSSRSRRFGDGLEGERIRELLILRLINNLNLSENFWISLRTEPFWDVQNQKFEFSMGLYAVCRIGVPLWKQE